MRYRICIKYQIRFILYGPNIFFKNFEIEKSVSFSSASFWSPTVLYLMLVTLLRYWWPALWLKKTFSATSVNNTDVSEQYPSQNCH